MFYYPAYLYLDFALIALGTALVVAVPAALIAYLVRPKAGA